MAVSDQQFNEEVQARLALEVRFREMMKELEDLQYKTRKQLGGDTKSVQVQMGRGTRLEIGSGNSVMKFDEENGLYIGNPVFASAPFRVNLAGDLTATSATISGSLTASAIDAGTGNASAHINTSGQFWVGHADFASAPAKIDNDGSATFTSITLTGATVNNSTLNFENTFGDGSDGNLTTTGNVTLTSDAYYNNLTIANGHTINTAGYRLFVAGTLTVQSGGILERTPNNGGNGGNGTDGAGGAGSGGSAGTAGSALADGSVKGALAGVAGVAGSDGVAYVANGPGNTSGNAGNNGNNGANITKSLVSNDAQSGQNGSAAGDGVCTGQTGSGGSGGTGGTGGTRSSTPTDEIRNAMAAYALIDFIDQSNMQGAPSNGGAATGGSGGCAKAGSSVVGNATSGGAGGSGGGGSNGGIVPIFARVIVVDSGGIIRANGGDGGDAGTSGNSAVDTDAGTEYAAGGTGGSSGGSGGEGGVLILTYSSYTNNGTVEAAGGSGGTGAAAGSPAQSGGGTGNTGTAGSTGTSGNTGELILIQV